MIIPAIDIIDEKIVRLYKGSYQHQTNYHENAILFIQQCIKQGAKMLHLIDLTGAKTPENRQKIFFNKILNAIKPINIQVGGGIRNTKDIETLLNAGATRVIFGSVAIHYPKLVKKWIKYFGSKVLVLATDTKINKAGKYIVSINGWQTNSNIMLDDMIQEYHSLGIKNILCTDINLDGTLQGSNINLYTYLCNTWPKINFQASGGITSLEEITKLKKSGIHSIIIGRAFLEKKFTITEAIKCWQNG